MAALVSFNAVVTECLQFKGEIFIWGSLFQRVQSTVSLLHGLRQGSMAEGNVGGMEAEVTDRKGPGVIYPQGPTLPQ